MSVSRKLIRNLTRPVGRGIEGGEQGSDPDVTLQTEILWQDDAEVLWDDDQIMVWD